MNARFTRITSAVTRPRAARQDAAKRLEAALPDLSIDARRRLLTRSFAHQARAAGELRELDRIDPARLCSRLDLEGWERIEEAERTGAGVVLLSAALGLFELLPIVLHLYKGGVDPQRCLSRLDRPELGRATDRSITLSFLGRPLQASTLAAAKALEQGWAALPVFAFLEPRRRFKVVVRPPIAAADGVVDKESLTRQFVATIEAEILVRPDQYGWFGGDLTKASAR